MKPNQQQQEFIKQKLLDLLKFRETYEELYDHILTALETVPEDVTFYDALDNIVQNELGGTRGIKLVDRRYIKLAIKEFIGDYFKALGRCLTTYPMLLITPITALYYLLLQYEWFNYIIADTLPLFMSLIPGAIVVIKKTIVQKSAGWKVLKIDYAKSSIRPFANIYMLFFPFFLWMFTADFCRYLQRVKIIPRDIDHFGMPANVAPFIFFMILVHSVAYYKMYKDWPKIIAASLI